MCSLILRGNVGAHDEIADRSRGENHTGSGCGDDSSRDMYAAAADIAVAEFDLAGLQARSDLQADPLPSYSPPVLVLGAGPSESLPSFPVGDDPACVDDDPSRYQKR
jgi:hypothetical protein